MGFEACCMNLAGPVDGAAIFEDVAESHIAVAAQHIQAKSVVDTHFGESVNLSHLCAAQSCIACHIHSNLAVQIPAESL